MYHTISPGLWEAAVETFNGSMVMAYQNGDLYGVDWMMFSGKPPGETVNFPVLRAMTAKNEQDGENTADSAVHTDGKTPLDSIEDDVTTVRLTVDKPLKEYRYIPRDQIEVRPDLRLPDNFAVKLGRAVAEGKTQRIDSLLWQAGTQLNEVSVADALGTFPTRGEQLKTAFNEMAATFDANGVPSDDRHIMLNPTDWYELLGVPGIITKEYGGQANVQRPGQVIIYANWLIHNGRSISWKKGSSVTSGHDYSTATDRESGTTSERPSDVLDWYLGDLSNALGVAWHSEGWALRHYVTPTSDVDWVAQFNSYKTEARLTMGARPIQLEGIGSFTAA
jgi:hypothetical protein